MSKRGTIDWDAQPLGEHTDASIARDLGVSTASVRYQRVKRGIEVSKQGAQVLANRWGGGPQKGPKYKRLSFGMGEDGYDGKW